MSDFGDEVNLDRFDARRKLNDSDNSDYEENSQYESDSDGDEGSKKKWVELPLDEALKQLKELLEDGKREFHEKYTVFVPIDYKMLHIHRGRRKRFSKRRD
jgi:hypothetical protein